MSSVEYHRDDGAGLITLTQSSEGNRLNLDSLKELKAALQAVLEDNAVRIIILRSNGATFSLGLDFGAVVRAEKGDEDRDGPDAVGEPVALYREILSTLFTSPKPVITLVQGEVKAGGVGLVCASDIVAATDNAGAELSEVIFGLIPANVLPYFLQTRVPLSRARYLILTAKRLGAEEARREGIFDEVFPPEKFEKGVKKICKQLFRSSPEALARTKAFTLQLFDTPFHMRPAEAELELNRILGRRETREEIVKFQEGDLPSWFSSFSPEGKLSLNPEE